MANKLFRSKRYPSDVYVALSEKDQKDLKKWFSGNRGGGKKRKKKTPRDNMDVMADQLKNSSYTDFLKSRYWSIVRKRVLKRDGYKCMNCGETKQLQVHHDTYRNHFREHRNLKDLMTLCEHCHKEHHFGKRLTLWF